MRNQYMILMLSFFTIISLLVSSSVAHKGPKSLEKWFKNLPHAKEKVTHLRFYFHDIVSGKNPTVVPVAKANSTFKSPTFFGLVSIIDNQLTVGPEPKSKNLGRAQGITGYASSEEFGLLMTINFVFTEGKFNGSTLSVVGINLITRKYREMPIVGGSGVFRLARGIATAETIKINQKSGDAVIEYNVMALHY